MTMKLLLKRIYSNDQYTIGRLYVDGVYICDTLEDCDRGLDSSMTEDEILSKKVYGETAIPTGTYKIDMKTVSPKYQNVAIYKNACAGKVPRIIGVKGFSGILIHIGNTNKDTKGCILVGKNTIKGEVTESRNTWLKVYYQMQLAEAIGCGLTITIIRSY